ncbi:hypothetical protein CKY47_35765 [Saccharothrix yanglingensis]|uniref:Uncharacterized protein n=1 Tax=Saccharothrix yanglingensis TaxID=659496 RepID=A0ABU0XB53_9PSEU|nr:hypothetical protein [Saccharothrix yanglingensis]
MNSALAQRPVQRELFRRQRGGAIGGVQVVPLDLLFGIEGGVGACTGGRPAPLARSPVEEAQVPVGVVRHDCDLSRPMHHGHEFVASGQPFEEVVFEALCLRRLPTVRRRPEWCPFPACRRAVAEGLGDS